MLQFRDFLQMYNGMSEICFKNCVDNFNSRTLEVDEGKCVEDCASKFIRFNHRLMENFIKLQNLIANSRMLKEESEGQANVDEKNVSGGYEEQTNELAVPLDSPAT